MGYNEGYRTSWDAAVGKVTAAVFEDNCKAWSGDHCVDPLLVPGVLFSNRKIDAEDPGIEDLAPTALRLFGVESARLDGRKTGFPAPMSNLFFPGQRAVTLTAFLLCAAMAISQSGCSRSDARTSAANGKRVIVLGIDGMDPEFLGRTGSRCPTWTVFATKASSNGSPPSCRRRVRWPGPLSSPAWIRAVTASTISSTAIPKP